MAGWGVGFLLLGIEVLWEPFHTIAPLFFGVATLMMVGTPCSMPIFNEGTSRKVFRGVLFGALGLASMARAFLP